MCGEKPEVLWISEEFYQLVQQINFYSLSCFLQGFKTVSNNSRVNEIVSFFNKSFEHRKKQNEVLNNCNLVEC